MENFIDTGNMLTLDELKNSNYDDRDELMRLAERVETYLSGQWWCKGVRQIYFDRGFGETVSIFYAEFEPNKIAEDKAWVILGELPPSYIEAVTCHTWVEALEAYVCRVQGWVDAFSHGEVVPGLNILPTQEHADNMSMHLNMIREVVLSEFHDSLLRGA